MKKKLFTLLTALVLILAMLPAASAAEPITGQCGPDARWSLQDSTLTISGTGTMDDFAGNAPWSAYKDQINQVNVEEGITSIGAFAFHGYQNLNFVYFPTSLRTIGDLAFFGCVNLFSAELTNGITRIGSSAFGESGLFTVRIPDTVTHIGNAAFASCPKLGEVTLGSGLIRAEGSVFRDCASLWSVIMPQMPNLEHFGEFFFMGCDNLTDLSFYTAPFLDANMFNGCDGLTDVTIPDCVTRLGEQDWSFVFKECANLTSVTLHPGVEIVGNGSFEDCQALETVRFQGNAPLFGVAAFQGAAVTCYYPANNPTWTEEVLQNYGGTVTWVPETIDAPTSGSFGDNGAWSFDEATRTLTITGKWDLPRPNTPECAWEAWRPYIETVIIGEGVTGLGNYTFLDHTALRSVQLPGSLVSTGSHVFEGCTALKEITLPEKLETIGEYTFYRSGLTGIDIPDKVNTLGECAFADCTELVSLKLPSGFRRGWGHVFRGCSSLTDIVMPEMPDLYLFGVGFFSDCDGLTDLSFYTAPFIDNYMFSGCDGLVNITIPECVERIITEPPVSVSFAFEECANLKTVTIPTGVEVIGPGCFNMCYSLEAVYFQGNAPEIIQGGALYEAACCYYPADNATWTEAFLQQHSGINWLPYAEPTSPFADVKETDYFFEPVLWAVENQITAGTGSGNFSPNAPCTRAQVVTFLHRAAGCPEPSITENPFTDVKSTDYFYKAVLWAVEKGITAGMSADTFAPNATCTRAQVVTFLYRAAGTPAPENTDNPFTDVAESDYFYNAVLWARSTNVTQGTSATAFSPNNDCTRGQVVTFLYRTHN